MRATAPSPPPHSPAIFFTLPRPRLSSTHTEPSSEQAGTAAHRLTEPFQQGRATLKYLSRFALLALVASLAACSVLGERQDRLQERRQAPDAGSAARPIQLSRDNRYNIPGGAVTANAYQTGRGQRRACPPPSRARRRAHGAHRHAALAGRQPFARAALGSVSGDFWQESGFLLTTEQRNLGIMETDWAENRAKLPQDIIRGTLGKLVDSIYSTGELDRFRTRMEAPTANGTEIFISHRGMQRGLHQHAPGPDRLAAAPCRPRARNRIPASPDGQARRLAGAGQQVAATAAAAPVQTARVANVGGQPIVQLSDGFDRAWRRVGLALDRTGFTVEDRDRSAGVASCATCRRTPTRRSPDSSASCSARARPSRRSSSAS